VVEFGPKISLHRMEVSQRPARAVSHSVRPETSLSLMFSHPCTDNYLG
jgi:hypothetical protein